MKAHVQYLRYLLRHKWWVAAGCRRMKVPFWRALTHDWSKFLPAEWFPYVASFYGPKFPSIFEFHGDERNQRLDGNRYKEAVQDNFDKAWLHHIHWNPHHWQHWILREDSGATKVLLMPDTYVREMVADWYGAGKAITGKNDLAAWFEKNKTKISLHPQTSEAVERYILEFAGVV